ACPTCDRPGRLAVHDPAAVTVWQCPGCDSLVQPPADAGTAAPPPCLVCGNAELYRKKDFPHWLGLTILTVACVASTVPYYFYMPVLVWAILLGSAALDGLLYLCVGDVVVCYRCGAHYRGLADRPDYRPHDLGVAERYRQERLRREQLRAQG